MKSKYKIREFGDTAKQAAIVAALLVAPFAFAQSGATDPEEVFQLSPFVVDGSGDVGYYATETLSGTQLRTDMRSLANPISVLTEEMMADIGAVSYEDAVNYLPSSGEFLGSPSDVDGNAARTGTPYVSRGFTVNALTQDFFSTNIRQDNFNTERLTQSRGPNSLLFGLGSVGGALNSGSKRGLLNRDSTRFDARYDSEGATRYTADFNKVIIEDKLALRLALLHDDNKTFRDLQYRRRSSAYANLTFMPSDRTTIHFSGEIGKSEENNPRSYLTKDRVTPWLNSPLADLDKANLTDATLIDTGSNAARNAARQAITGVSQTYDTQAWVAVIMNDPSLPAMNYAYKSQGSYNYLNGRYHNNFSITDPQITDDVYFPLTTVVAGPADSYDVDYTKQSITLDHQLFETTYLQVVHGFEESDTFDQRPVARQAWMLNVDNNYYLPNQRISDNPNPDLPLNPYYGMPYIESNLSWRNGDDRMEQFRTTLSHQQEFGDASWLGKVSVVGTYYTRKNSNFQETLEESNIIGVNPNGTIQSNVNRQKLHRRYYLTGDNAPNFPDFGRHNWEPVDQTYDPSFGSHRGVTVAEGAYIVPTVQSQMLARNTPVRQFEDTKSTYFLGQWRLLEDRVMLTAGTRTDDITANQATYTRGFDKWFTEPDAWAFNDDNITESSATNTNYGIVVKPHHMFDFYYNEATNTVTAGQAAFDVYNNLHDDQNGDGWDAGFRTFLLNDKIVLKLNYFENTQLNSTSFTVVNPGGSGVGLIRSNGAVEVFRQGMVNNGRGAEVANAVPFQDYRGGQGFWNDVEDTFSSGYELEVVYNPNQNVRMMLNVTNNETVMNDTLKTFRKWLNEFVAPVADDAALRALDTGTGSNQWDNMGEVIDDLYFKQDFHLATLGGPQVRSNPWAANFVGSYSFSDDSMFKGFRTGITTRWRTAPIIGYEETGGRIDPTKTLEGLDVFLSDVFVTKSWRGEGGKRWEGSLRVRNAFNDDGFYPNLGTYNGVDSQPQYTQQVFNAPRSYEFSLGVRY